MIEEDFALSVGGEVGVVGDDDESRALPVEAMEDVEDELLVGLVEIPGGFVGQDDLRMVDEGAGDAHALLLTAGQLRGQVVGSVPQTHVLQGLHGLLLVRHRMVVLRHHDILDGCQMRDKVELLEDQADDILADVGELGRVEAPELAPVKGDGALGGRVHAADDVHQRRLARA